MHSWIRWSVLPSLLFVASTYPYQAKADAIQVNGTCEVGNCANPGPILPGSPSATTPFSFNYTFANTDLFNISGRLSVQFLATQAFQMTINDLVVTYEGNSAGTSSGNDVLVNDFLEEPQYRTGGNGTDAFESIGGVFGPGLSFASGAQGQFSLGTTPFPLLGPFTPPPAEFLQQISGLPFSVPTGASIARYQYTLTFGQGSAIGSSIYVNPTTPPTFPGEPSPVPEPSSIVMLGTGLAAALTSKRKQLFPGFAKAGS
jgi:hypothetical protein